jgi:hypothetical protein
LLKRENHLSPPIPRPLTDIQYKGDIIDALILDNVA